MGYKRKVVSLGMNDRSRDCKRQWKQHLARMWNSRPAKQVWKYTPIGHRSVDRPTKTWLEKGSLKHGF